MTLKYEKITANSWDYDRNTPLCPDKGAFEIRHDTGSIYFVLDGKPHKEDGPAVICPNGTKCYYQRGELHRLDGPAVIYPNGTRYYYQHGKRHRLDGPAAIFSDGSQRYCLFGKEYQKEEWELKVIQLRLKEQIV